MESMCRICLESGENLDFTHIYSNNKEISLKLFLISGVKIIEFSKYSPALICQHCLKELYQCFMFRKKCQSADEFFKTRHSQFEQRLWDGDEDGESVSEALNVVKVESNDCTAVELDLIDYEPCKEEVVEEACSSNESFVEEEFLDEDLIAQLQDDIVEPKESSQVKPARKRSVNESLRCRFCDVMLSRRNRRIEHERLHLISDTQQYKCAFCGKKFNQKCGLIPHFVRFHSFTLGPKEKWKCAICYNKILPPGNLALHYEKEHSNFSGKSSVSRRDFKGVLSQANKNNSQTRLKKSPRKREAGKSSQVPKNFWPCSICGNSFSNYPRYQKHLKTHEVVDVLENSAAIRNISEIRENIRDEPEKKPKIPCTTCGKAFSSAMTVRAHEKTHLNMEYTCDLCGSSFRVKAYLTAHVQKIHMKLKKFKCSIENCSASFVHRELLNYHVRKHLNIRNFACRYCAKTFVTRSCCKIHERIHTDERPYSCKFCGRTFIHHSDHRRHETKHEQSGLVGIKSTNHAEFSV